MYNGTFKKQSKNEISTISRTAKRKSVSPSLPRPANKKTIFRTAQKMNFKRIQVQSNEKPAAVFSAPNRTFKLQP